MPKVSVIVNCYNSAKYLREALDSIVAQTFGDWELIFWDNQSTDKSAEIVKSYADERIKYFYAPRHTTLGEARNLAIDKASAEWIAFLDCDDLWEKNKLEKQVAIINSEDGSLGLVYSRAYRFTDDGERSELVEDYIGKPLPEGHVLRELLTVTNFIPLMSAVIRKSAFIKVGGIPQHLKQAEDYYMFAAIAAEYKVRAAQEFLSHYRWHQNNLSHNQKLLNYVESIEVLNDMAPYLPDAKDKRLIAHKLCELHTWAGIIDIRHERRLATGVKRILSSGSVVMAIAFTVKWVFGKLRSKLFTGGMYRPVM